MIERRFDVVSGAQLDALAAAPGAAASEASSRIAYRDLYIDTDDDRLQRRGITCRLRLGSDDRRTLTAFVGTPDDPSPPRRYDALVESSDPRVVLAGESEPARRLLGIVDPRLLQTRLELQVERVERVLERDWKRRPRLLVVFDRIQVRRGTASRTFHQITVRASRESAGYARECARLEADAGLRPIAAGTRERAQLLLKWMERDERGRVGPAEVAVALVLTRGTTLAVFRTGAVAAVPCEPGSGVGVARTLLDRITQSAISDVRQLGKVTAIGPSPTLEVWTAEIAEGGEISSELGTVAWVDRAGAVNSAAQLDDDAVAALSVALRTGLLVPAPTGVTPLRGVPAIAGATLGRQSRLAPATRTTVLRPPAEPAAEEPSVTPHLLNAELSILAFTARVLSLAEDLGTPLAARQRYLSIVADHLDELFMIRVAGLKRLGPEQAEERSGDGLTPREELAVIAANVRALVARHYRCYAAWAAEAESCGGRLLTWNELDATQREELMYYMRADLLPALTPLAMTLSPGHPFPRLRHLSLSLAVVVLDRPGAAPHFAQVEIPSDTPRVIALGDGTAITVEEVVRANAHLLYPSSVVEQAYAFRVTRGADLDIDEDRAPTLLHAVEEAALRRADQPVIRVEVERAMPTVLRDILLRELRRESGAETLGADDIYEIDGPLDLHCLDDLSLVGGAELDFPDLESGDPLRGDRSIWAEIAGGDRLFHHPFDAFSATVARFFREAAADPAVTAIKMCVYRADDGSPIVAALIDAAAAGKDVVVFVEVKARFDEERNVAWARRLEAAGGRVVYGLVGIKTHAKVALVVRRESGQFCRYVHVGTGNYNATTAKRYTDLSLFSTNEALSADIQDLFNELTGRARAPERLTRGCLISPKQLLSELVARIEREAAHARSGRRGHLRIKVNGLSDPDIVNALVRASQDGVQIELVVRGVCTLRPGVPGVTEHITIISVLGRFLEHSRAFYFANAGAPEYFIGSADMRPRNLRRRVELLVPVLAPDCRAGLDALFERYLADPTAWELTAGGDYIRRDTGGVGAQESLVGGGVGNGGMVV